jgi:enterochelin esterase-like enzyme
MIDRRALSTMLGLAAWLPAAAQATRRITIRARVPEKAGTVYLTGNLPELGPWDPSKRAMEGLGPERRLVLDVPAGLTLEFKLTLGSWAREGLGPSGTVLPNFRVMADADREVEVAIVDFKSDPRLYLADPAGGGVLGTLVYWHDVPSRHLRAARHVSVWLPPSYARSRRRYPMLVMHDGQNLFDPRIANTGVDWGVDEAVVRNAAAGRMPEVIVVSPWSTADRRVEYSPWHQGPAYGRFLVEELLPEVHAEFRTLKGPRHTAVMGSSMGGLISFDLCRRHPGVFGAGGCVSTHFPFAVSTDGLNASGKEQPFIERDIERGLRFARGPRLYFDHGTVGLDALYEPVQAKVNEWLRGQGWREGRDFVARRFDGADHNEAAWRARLDEPLGFLYRGRG